MANFDVTQKPIDQLILDPNNYRFQDDPSFVFADEKRFHEESVQQKTEKKLRDDTLISLKKSIIENGFLPVEPLVIREYEHKPNTYLVLEGNRRLAALRWIEDDIESGVPVPQQTKEQLKSIPVIVVKSDADDQGFYESLMGVRHVSGIKQWGGYQRARLVAVLQDERNLDPEQVADRLGMSVREVNRRYRAYKALEQMQHSEEYSEFAKPTMYPIFHEAVSLPVVRDQWLTWNADSFGFVEDENLDDFYSLITPNNPEEYGTKDPKIRTYSDVRELKIILPHDEARQVLLDQSRTFFDAIAIAKQQELSHAWVNRVNSAISALEAIDYKEIKNLSSENLERLTNLSALAQELIAAHTKLKDATQK